MKRHSVRVHCVHIACTWGRKTTMKLYCLMWP